MYNHFCGSRYLNEKMRVPIFLLLLYFVSAYISEFKYDIKECKELNFLPMPQKVECDITNKEPHKMEDPCSILYHIRGNKDEHIFQHFKELIEHQQYKTFKCHLAHVMVSENLESVKLVGFKYQVQVTVTDPTLKSAFKVSEQAYKLTIDQEKAEISSEHYVGFVRALETFMQSITCDKYRVRNCEMIKLPIRIIDEPAFSYRGLMVDSARHFLPMHLLYETVDAVMYNKMNVLHWHIVDEDSFPFKLDSHPEIAEYAAFSEEETYSTLQARDLVRYAMVRGVRVIPQMDTPGHAASWALAPQNKEIACTFGRGYMGPLDVTLEKTYQLVRDVFKELIDIFPDPYIHLGGDEVTLTCLQNKTQFISKEQIDEKDIERQYRRKQHKIIKELNPSKIPIYWMNSNQIYIEDGDVVQWWGTILPPTKNPVIISNYGPFYIDMGVGNYFGNIYGTYTTWLDLYNQNIGKMIKNYENRDNVLGAQITLWTEVSNQYTHHIKVWIRGSSMAERTWTKEDHPAKPNFLKRLGAHERLMNRRGIPTAPGTCQQCEYHPEYC